MVGCCEEALAVADLRRNHLANYDLGVIVQIENMNHWLYLETKEPVELKNGIKIDLNNIQTIFNSLDQESFQNPLKPYTGSFEKAPSEYHAEKYILDFELMQYI